MIVIIGRLSVALGIIVSLITIATGLGSKKAIQERVADFSGHITVKSTQSNASYDTSVLDRQGLQLNKIIDNPEVASVQSFATTTGIFRTKDNFSGIINNNVNAITPHVFIYSRLQFVRPGTFNFFVSFIYYN